MGVLKKSSPFFSPVAAAVSVALGTASACPAPFGVDECLLFSPAAACPIPTPDSKHIELRSFEPPIMQTESVQTPGATGSAAIVEGSDMVAAVGHATAG